MDVPVSTLIIKTIADLSDHPVIRLDDHLVDDLGLDSLELVSLAMVLAGQFDLQDDFDFDTRTVVTVEDVVRVVEEKIGQKATNA